MPSSTWPVGVMLLAAVLTGCTSGQHERKTETPRDKRKPPAEYRVELDTTKGDIVIRVVREWAPHGADRFWELVQEEFFDGARFYRVRKGFIAQFGIAADPKANELWQQLKIPDDPVKMSNKRGFVSFAANGPASRTTQVFINLRNNQSLDKQSFAPFGEVVEGMEVADKLFAGYGEVESMGGGGPDPVKLATQGDVYVKRMFGSLDQIRKATIIQ